MKQKTEKMNIFKHAGAIFAIAGGMFLGTFVGARGTNNTPDVKVKKEYVKQPSRGMESTEYKGHIRQLEQRADKMSREQKLRFIEGRERFLKKLDEKIKSKDLNPEERFDARRSRSLVIQELALMRQKLGNER